MRQQHDPWESGASWWLDVIADDPIYVTDVLPLLRLLITAPAGPWLDVGCGDGRAAAALPAPQFGCDIAPELLSVAARHMPVMRSRIPDLHCLRARTFAGASLVLVLEHVRELIGTFAALRRTVATGGELVVIANHPAFTAPDSGPIIDPTDGEVLWRWGPYFDSQTVATHVGGRQVPFHHRPIGTILTAAAEGGWCLEALEERPLSVAAVEHEPGYYGQQYLPRLAGFRWRNPE
ncbi:MAG TPA: class I SAM-dependent methyltransferase [Acidimicrobiia bacterium]|jgi:SAM-dependent methyltransferase|nr:class I SAM-dependent methyltransferase [Acidimicrobiia bacterium]